MLHQLLRVQHDVGVPAERWFVSASMAMRRQEVGDHGDRTPAATCAPRLCHLRLKGESLGALTTRVEGHGGDNKYFPVSAGRADNQVQDNQAKELKRMIAADKIARAEKRKRARH
mmetsp:Transcript_20712/g.53068  ORF Transcript_20712/g.53068 Transcript_20712/m.53068 type:complete len:115 (+) Transcript_20712:1776-2120(+)